MEIDNLTPYERRKGRMHTKQPIVLVQHIGGCFTAYSDEHENWIDWRHTKIVFLVAAQMDLIDVTRGFQQHLTRY